VTVNNFFYFK